MNERIRALAEQVKVIMDGDDDLEFYTEKFAELIVKDCLYIVEPMQDNSDEWCVTLKATAQAIKEHFGLELKNE